AATDARGHKPRGMDLIAVAQRPRRLDAELAVVITAGGRFNPVIPEATAVAGENREVRALRPLKSGIGFDPLPEPLQPEEEPAAGNAEVVLPIGLVLARLEAARESAFHR